MSPAPLNLPIFDARGGRPLPQLDALREKLSPRGDVVSAAGRQRTIDVFGEPLTPQQVVTRICEDVRRDGLAAALDYSARIDQKRPHGDELRVSPEDLAAAHEAADEAFLASVRRIRDNILRFQSAILHRDVELTDAAGNRLMQRYTPLRRVGICVPGGAAAYPSSVLMTAVPAQAAGVPQIAVVAPPTANGAYNRDMLAVCQELGIREVYRIGGAQAVAALAYGVEGIEQVDKIVGPGNLFVALAKQYVFGDVDIDSIAGPSEVVVIADEQTPLAHTAADMLAQAEHAPGASILITWHAPHVERIVAELERQLTWLDRGELARACLEEFGAVILVDDAAAAVALTNQIAPEHLHIATADCEQLMPQIPSAGATFLGPYSPVALGDYAAGPSHVLPTGGTARFASGLSSNDFLRSSSVIQYTQAGLAEVAGDIGVIANKEGLTAHRRSVEVRL